LLIVSCVWLGFFPGYLRGRNRVLSGGESGIGTVRDAQKENGPENRNGELCHGGPGVLVSWLLPIAAGGRVKGLAVNLGLGQRYLATRLA
jgi:hypothetical protein